MIEKEMIPRNLPTNQELGLFVRFGNSNLEAENHSNLNWTRAWNPSLDFSREE